MPVSLEKGLPCRLSPPIRRRFDSLRLQNIADRPVRNGMSQVCQGALNSVIAPSRIFFGHSQQEFNDLLRHRGSPSALPAVAIVPVPGNEFPMPPQDCFGSHDGGKLVEHFAPQDLAFDGEAPALVVVEQDSVFSELLSEDPVFRQ